MNPLFLPLTNKFGKGGIFDFDKGSIFDSDAASLSAASSLVIQLLAWKRLGIKGNALELDTFDEACDERNPLDTIALNLERLSSREKFDKRPCEAAIARLRKLSPDALCGLLKGLQGIDASQLGADLARLRPVSGKDLVARHTVPLELASFLCHLARVSEGTTVYVPFETSFNIALKAGLLKAEVYAEFQSQELSDWLRMVNLALGTKIHVRVGDPLEGPSWLDGDRLRKFEVAIAGPSYSERSSSSQLKISRDGFERGFPEKPPLYDEVLELLHAHAQAQSRTVFLASNPMLFRTNGGEAEFKRKLLHRNQLAAIVALPEAIMERSKFGTAALVLERGEPRGEVLMVDASGPDFFDTRRDGETHLLGTQALLDTVHDRRVGAYSRLVSTSACENLDYNLSPGRYVLSGERLMLHDRLMNLPVTVPLTELVDVIRPLPLPPPKEDEEGMDYLEITLSDFGDDDYLERPKRRARYGSGSSKRAKHQMVKAGDILLAFRGAVGRVALVPEDLGVPEPMQPNQSLVILRTKRDKHHLEPVLLLRFLASELGQWQLLERVAGQILQANDIRSLIVAVPGDEEAAQVMATDKEIREKVREARRLMEETAVLRRKHWPR